MRAADTAAAAPVLLAVHLVLVRLLALQRVHLDFGQRAAQEAGLDVRRWSGMAGEAVILKFSFACTRRHVGGQASGRTHDRAGLHCADVSKGKTWLRGYEQQQRTSKSSPSHKKGRPSASAHAAARAPSAPSSAGSR